MPTEHVTFPDLAALLKALWAFRGSTAEMFPDMVWRDPEGIFSLPLEEFRRPKNEIERLSAQNSWGAVVVSRSSFGGQVSLAGEMARILPVRVDPIRRLRGLRGAVGDTLHFNPAESDAHYLLAARTPDKAQGILNVLTSLLTLGIQAKCVLPQGDQPFAFFWRVQSQARSRRTMQPCRMALDAADRAWWGPVARGHVKVYVQWPFGLPVPPACLGRIQWGLSSGLALIGPDKPELLTLELSEESQAFADLIEVADLRLGDKPATCRRGAPADAPPCKLNVELRLVREPPERSARRRLDYLDLEIRAKTEMRDRLRETAEALPSRGVVTPEPLFLYPSAEDALPYALRRLILEWTDQPEELGRLRYQLCSSADFPEELRLHGSRVHVLTTDTALRGGDRSSVLGLRMTSYAPTGGGLLCFSLLHDWAPFGLRIFTPRDSQLELYPDVRPGRLAAGKLSAVLLDGLSKAKPETSCILLTPAQSGNGPRVCVLPFDGFRQLSRAFEWDCGLEHPATAEALESVRLKSRLDVLSAVREGIQAATQAAYDRLRRHRVALRRRLGKEAEEMRKIQDHVESSRRILTRVESGLASLAGPIESLAKDMESLAEHVRDLPEAVTDLAQVAQRLLEMVSTLRTQEDGLASLRKACADIASRLAGDRGASPANTPPTGEGQPPPSADDQAAPDGESDQ